MHILHIVQLYYPVESGAGRYFAEVGERLAAEGHRVTVLSTDAYDLEYFWNPARRRVETPAETHNGVRIIRFPVHRIPGPPIVYPILRRLMVELSRVPATAPLLRRMAMLTPRLPDMRRFFQAHAAAPPSIGIPPFALIHATNITLDFAIVPAFDFARAHSIPFIATPFVHLGPPGDSSILRYYSMRHQIDLLRRSARVITMTGLEGDALAARGVDRARLRRVGVGVNPAEVAGGDGARFRAEQRIDGQLVLYIGAMAFDKGVVHTVEAMQRLWAQGENATLALIGAPLAHFTEFYERLPATDQARIRLLPYAPDQVKRESVRNALAHRLVRDHLPRGLVLRPAGDRRARGRRPRCDRRWARRAAGAVRRSGCDRRRDRPAAARSQPGPAAWRGRLCEGAARADLGSDLRPGARSLRRSNE